MPTQTPTASPTGNTGYGAVLGFAPPGTGPTGTFTLLATIESITPIGSEVDKAEATLLNSPVKVNNPGIPELSASAKVRYDPGDLNIRSLEQAQWKAPIPNYDFQIKDVNAATVTWTGFISSFKPDEYQPGETRTASVEFVINTVPVYTAGSY